MSTQPIAPPTTVKVGGKSYQIRFGTGAFFLLSKWGIPSTRIATILNEYFADGRNAEAMITLSAPALGNFDAAMDWHTAGLSPLELADKLRDEEIEPLFAAVWKEFLGKTGLEEKKAPAETLPASPKTSTKTDGSDVGPSELPEPVSA